MNFVHRQCVVLNHPEHCMVSIDIEMYIKKITGSVLPAVAAILNADQSVTKVTVVDVSDDWCHLNVHVRPRPLQ